MKISYILATLLMLTTIGVTSSANAQRLITGSSIDTIIAVARGYGSAALASQSNGAPKISGSIAGMGYAIYFTGCTKSRNCTELNFYAGFIDVKPTLDKINTWNASKRFGRAYLDADRDASIEMDVNLKEGISRENMAANFEIWRLVLVQFAQFSGFN